MARCHRPRAGIAATPTRPGLQRDAMAASQRAISLAPNYGLARDALALQYLQSFDIRSALAEANAAAALAPANALVLIHVSGMLRGIEPDRAVMIARQALTLDPLNLSYIDRYGRALNAARRYKEAAEAGRQAMASSNNFIALPPMPRSRHCASAVPSRSTMTLPRPTPCVPRLKPRSVPSKYHCSFGKAASLKLPLSHGSIRSAANRASRRCRMR